jgi:hypothetical protein
VHRRAGRHGVYGAAACSPRARARRAAADTAPMRRLSGRCPRARTARAGARRRPGRYGPARRAV